MLGNRFAAACAKVERRPTSVTLADLFSPNVQLVFVNAAFTRHTGYSKTDALGRNCRFLQGHGPDPGAISAMRQASEARRHAAICVRNYRKDGTPLENLVILSPLFEPHILRPTQQQRRPRFMLGCQFALRPARRTGLREILQGEIDPSCPEKSGLDPIQWDSLLARSSAVQLVLSAHIGLADIKEKRLSA